MMLICQFFWVGFGRIIAWTSCWRKRAWGHKIPPKRWPSGDYYWSVVISKFWNFRSWTPPNRSWLDISILGSCHWPLLDNIRNMLQICKRLPPPCLFGITEDCIIISLYIYRYIWGRRSAPDMWLTCKNMTSRLNN